MMRLSGHAKVMWDCRFPHLDLNEEIDSLRRLSTGKRKKVYKQCPAHEKEMRKNVHRKWYMISRHGVIFVCTRTKVVTVFPYGKKETIIYSQEESGK